MVAENREIELTDTQIDLVRLKLNNYDYSDYNEYIDEQIDEVLKGENNNA